MKRLSALFACLLSVGASWSQTGNWTDEGNYDTSWYDGNNSGEYHISTPQQLAGWAYLASQGNRMSPNRIVLDNDLDLSAHYWTPIKEFAGFLDGNGKTLSGVHIQTTAGMEDVGFIARLLSNVSSTKSVVYDLTLDESCQISLSAGSRDLTLGGIVGYAYGNTTIASCRFQGSFSVESAGDLDAGGIVGRSSGAVILCTNEGDLTFRLTGSADASCGGITGGNFLLTSPTVTGCANKGNLYATSTSASLRGIALGGIAGETSDKTVINGCMNEGSVKSEFTRTQYSFNRVETGGIVADNNGTVISCGNEGEVSTLGSKEYETMAVSGGISGDNAGQIINCYNAATVTCNGNQGFSPSVYNNAGGIVGYSAHSSYGFDHPYIYGSYNTGAVTSDVSDATLGSIVGQCDPGTDDPATEIRRSYYNAPSDLPSVGDDPHQQATHILGVVNMKGADFCEDLNQDAKAYNDTTQSVQALPWVGHTNDYPTLRQPSEVLCSSTNYFTADFILLSPEENASTEGLYLRYKEASATEYTEVAWGTATTLQIDVKPNTTYEYMLVLKEGDMECRMAAKNFRTGYLFEEMSVSTTRTTADFLVKLNGDPSKIKKVTFELGKEFSAANPNELEVIATKEGSALDEWNFSRATMEGLEGNTSYIYRVIVETTAGTFTSGYSDFTTKNTGLYGKTVEDQATQTTLTLIHSLITDRMEGTLVESGCYYYPFDLWTTEEWNDLGNWTKIKGEAVEYGKEEHAFKTVISGLKEGTKYSIRHYAIVNIPGEGNIEEVFYAVNDFYETLPVTGTWQLQEATQTTALLSYSFDTGDATVLEKWLEMNGEKYELEANEGTLKLTGLAPGKSYSPTVYVQTPNGTYASEGAYFTTESVIISGNVTEALQTSALIEIVTNLEDDTLGTRGVEWKVNGQTFRTEGNPCRITDLPANSTLSFRPFVYIDDFYNYGEWENFSTQPISVTIEAADACSNTSATLHAKTECDPYSDAQFGFEWRFSDAPDDMPSTTVIAKAPIDGNLAFSLRGLEPSQYYRYRAFVKYQEREYFSDWISFRTAAAFVLFPPTVQTYLVTAPDGTSVILLGYVLAGSEEILQKGFEYWETEPLKRAGEKQVVIVEGEEMKAELRDLKPHTTYAYRSFVVTASGTTYGEEQTFTTGEGTGIAGITGTAPFEIRLTSNPVREVSTLTIESAPGATALLRVYTLNGNLVRQEELTVEDGHAETRLYAHDFAKGIHLLQVVCNGQARTLKMVVK